MSQRAQFYLLLLASLFKWYQEINILPQRFQCYGFSIYAVLRTLVLGNLPVPYRMVSYNILVPFTSVVDYPCTLYKSVVQSACTQYWSCVALEDTARYAGLLLSPGLQPRAFFLLIFLAKKRFFF